MDELIEDIKQDIINKLEYGYDCYIEDLHHELCNTDYFIIGRYQAKKWLGDNVFDAIEKIKDWELETWGEVTTDFSEPEKVANILAYIVGEELLARCEYFNEWHSRGLQMNIERNKILIEQLKNFDNYLELR
mgnify:CR=1 FL=1